MTLLEAVLLALALCADSLVLSTTCAFKSKMPYRKGLLMAVTFGLFQGTFPLLGALLGEAFSNIIASIDHWIAFALLALVGGKMIWDAFHPDDNERQLDVTRFSTMCILGVAESIDAFVVGITFGLSSTLASLGVILGILVGSILLSLIIPNPAKKPSANNC